MHQIPSFSLKQNQKQYCRMSVAKDDLSEFGTKMCNYGQKIPILGHGVRLCRAINGLITNDEEAIKKAYQCDFVEEIAMYVNPIKYVYMYTCIPITYIFI